MFVLRLFPFGLEDCYLKNAIFAYFLLTLQLEMTKRLDFVLEKNRNNDIS